MEMTEQYPASSYVRISQQLKQIGIDASASAVPVASHTVPFHESPSTGQPYGESRLKHLERIQQADLVPRRTTGLSAATS